jgi:YjbE family integral membrane protein
VATIQAAGGASIAAGNARDLMADFGLQELGALASVLLIDLVLAGDNAIIVGMAAAGLGPADRRRAIFLGIAAATVLRIAFASVALQLLAIIGLTLAGGILLLWVAWKLFREIRRGHAPLVREEGQPAPVTKTFWQACLQIVLADISMSLDNVLAVAGAARANWLILTVGLTLSVALMGTAAHLVARLLGRYPWISWLGLGLIAVVALRMIYEGAVEVIAHAAL